MMTSTDTLRGVLRRGVEIMRAVNVVRFNQDSAIEHSPQTYINGYTKKTHRESLHIPIKAIRIDKKYAFWGMAFEQSSLRLIVNGLRCNALHLPWVKLISMLQAGGILIYKESRVIKFNKVAPCFAFSW